MYCNCLELYFMYTHTTIMRYDIFWMPVVLSCWFLLENQNESEQLMIWSRPFFTRVLVLKTLGRNAKIQMNIVRSLNLGEQNSMSIKPQPPWDPQIDSNGLLWPRHPHSLPLPQSQPTLIIDSPLLEYSICQILVGDIEKDDSVSFLHCNVITENWSMNYETSWTLYFCALLQYISRA